MDTITDDRADAWFHALSDRTRRDILRRVMLGEQSVSSLARNYSMSLTAVQKHVSTLERAGLITRRRNGRETVARGEAGAVRSAAQLLTELEDVWRERIARIDDFLDAEVSSPPAAPHHPPTAQRRAAAPSPPRKD